MTRILLLSTAAVFALFLIGAGAQAHDDNKTKHDEREHSEGHAQEHGAHEHGFGQLDLALEGVELVIELTLPAADVVGFEHPASSKAEHDAVHAGIDKLSDGGRLFAFSKAAGCRFARTEVDPGHMEGHADGHAKDDDEAEHADFQARYRARCEHPEELSVVEVKLFQAFPTAQTIRARWITPKGQGAANLTPDQPKLTF